MASLKHNLAIQESIPTALKVRGSEPKVPQSEIVVRAQELLRCFGIPAKNFAYELKVSERYVQMMANGEKPVLGWMIKQIIEIGEEQLLKQKKAIDAYIERALHDAYGRIDE